MQMQLQQVKSEIQVELTEESKQPVLVCSMQRDKFSTIPRLQKIWVFNRELREKALFYKVLEMLDIGLQNSLSKKELSLQELHSLMEAFTMRMVLTQMHLMISRLKMEELKIIQAHISKMKMQFIKKRKILIIQRYLYSSSDGKIN